jgi:DNA-directed RNA polymerase subunit RPC12/RpoP
MELKGNKEFKCPHCEHPITSTKRKKKPEEVTAYRTFHITTDKSTGKKMAKFFIRCENCNKYMVIEKPI